MLALLQRVEFLVRLHGVQQVAAVFALQERKAIGWKFGMHGKRHRVSQSARINLAAGVGISRSQSGKDSTRRRREHPNAGERRRAFTRGARHRDRFEAAVGGGADTHKNASDLVEYEWLERMDALFDRGSVRKRDFPARQ